MSRTGEVRARYGRCLTDQDAVVEGSQRVVGGQGLRGHHVQPWGAGEGRDILVYGGYHTGGPSGRRPGAILQLQGRGRQSPFHGAPIYRRSFEEYHFPPS